MEARTRFAPSPTGSLHIGNIRTALFAWLVARKTNGKFILRLEDTDKQREVAGSEKYIIDCLQLLRLNHDEGPDVGGPYGPYKQSERLDIYRTWAYKLVAASRAYGDPYTTTELSTFRENARVENRPFLFRNHRPENPPAWDGTTPLRFKSEPKPYRWHDEVMGDLSTGSEVIDDFILIKSDGYPTYNFGHIVDDYLMHITHVIRSQEFIASVPRFLNLYEAMGIEHPLLATVPFVMGSDGNKKLSKRDGAKDIMDYIHEGFLPDSLINFMATLGWNDGTEQEIFSRSELIDKFSLNRVQRSGARFDEQRLIWMNGYHIRKLPIDKLYKEVEKFWPEEAISYDEPYKKSVLGAIQERLKYFSELPELTIFFFKDLPYSPDLIDKNKLLQKFDHQTLKNLLEQSQSLLSQSNFSTEDLSSKLNQLLTQTTQKPAILFSLIRIATTQAKASPALAETLAILGKDVSLRRMDQTIAAL